MLTRPHTLPSGFIPPCLPTKAPRPPAGAVWLHEIKHDGFRVIARNHGPRVRLYSRPGNDLTRQFPLIVETLARLRSRSALSTVRLSPATRTALHRSISSATTAPTIGCSFTLST
jgi:ATP-dependent DNA ligase